MGDELIDITGQKYGLLTVLERIENDKDGKAFWRCLCDCGRETTAAGTALRAGQRATCGCKNVIDITGERYGMLTVLERVESDGSPNALWRCLCDCGREIIARGTRLRQSTTKNCDQHRKHPPGVAPANILYAQYRRAARKKGLVFELGREEFLLLTKKNCHYCDQQPAQITRGYKGDIYIYNGIDRVDNEKGYIEENVVPCCKTCNRAKRTMPVEEFLAWIARAAKHQGMIL